MSTLMIITASVRPGRKGPAIAKWIRSVAARDPEWQIIDVDLKTLGLPMHDEAAHPATGTYENQHTHEWSRLVDSADAFLVVTPEYNFSFPASLKNALDYLHREWHYKPMAFVSYGGLAAGTRAVQMLKQVVTSLKMMPMYESVNIPFFRNHLDEHGEFVPNESMQRSADAMLKELHKWAGPLAQIRKAA
ncbi:MAG TPA: NAD(P)H-dependent oxidoreductase [Devosiaceae bacterium]